MVSIAQRDTERRRLSQPAPSGDGGGGTEVAPARAPAPPASIYSQLLQSNRPSIERLGGELAGSLGERREAATEALGSAQRGFAEDVSQGGVNIDSDILQRLRSGQALSLSEPEREQIRTARDATYGGPRSLEETSFFAPAVEAVREAEEVAGLSETSGGRRALLQQLYPDRNVTAGVSAFDEALLYGSDVNRERLARERAQIEPLAQQLQDVSGQALEEATAAREATQGAREATRGALEEAKAGFQGGLEARTEAARQAAMDWTEQIRRELGDVAGEGYLIPGQTTQGTSGFKNTLEALGFTEEEWQRVSDMITGIENIGWVRNPRTALGTVKSWTPTDITGQTFLDLLEADLVPEAAITPSNVASEEDYAVQQVLNEILSAPTQFITTPEEAGTAPESLIQFDPERARSALQGIAARDLENYIDLTNAINRRHAEKKAKNFGSYVESYLKSGVEGAVPGVDVFGPETYDVPVAGLLDERQAVLEDIVRTLQQQGVTGIPGILVGKPEGFV